MKILISLIFDQLVLMTAAAGLTIAILTFLPINGLKAYCAAYSAAFALYLILLAAGVRMPKGRS